MRFSWRIVLAFAVSAVLMYVALYDVDWADVATTIRGSNLALWVAATVVSQLTFPLRAMRWRVILAPVAPGLAFGPAWRATAVGMMVNNTVPARIGELTRAYALAHEEPRVPFTTGLASLVVDRALDALVVLLLLFVAILDPSFGTQVDVGGKTLGAVVTLGSLAVAGAFAALCLAVFAPAAMEALIAAIVNRMAPRLSTRAVGLVRNLTAGLNVLRDGRKFALVLLWTLVHWLVNAFAFWLGFKAIGVSVPLTAALLVQGLIAIGVALPSMPGFFGPFELAAKVALALYGIEESRAFSWAIGYHILSFIPITLIGAYYLTKMGGSISGLRPPTASSATS
jgi:uncharacterized protein (TIRG00374 family)